MRKILLDPFNETKASHEYKIIETEVSFLEYALSKEHLHIRENWLCKWAETFFKGREIEFKYARSIVRELVNLYEHLSENEAVRIYEMLEERDNPDIKLYPVELLNGCFPDPLWWKNSSVAHGAEWLLWLIKEKPKSFFEPIIKQVCANWIEADSLLSPIYTCYNHQLAEEILFKWICYVDTELIESIGSFPKQLPPNWLARKIDFFDKKIIETKGKFILKFLEHESNHNDKLIITTKSIEYFSFNPHNISPEVFFALKNFATDKDLARLNKLQPMAEPQSIPSGSDQVFLWFDNEYLPYRQRSIEVNDEEARRISIEKAQEFSLWYLDYYPRAIIKGQNLAPHRAQKIKEQHKEYVSLFVILDGLNVIDSKILINAILSAEYTNNLDLVENSFVFSLLPTVTEFTKKYIVNGSLSINSEKLDKLGVDISDDHSPVDNLSKAKPGEIIIWRIQEPDNTYHSGSKAADLPTKIKGQLVIISERIKEVVKETPLYCSLRIIITTDHGRMLGKSQRDVKVPNDMVAHGRAAWGNSALEFDSKGYLIENNIVYISDDSYYLNGQTVAIILSDQAFEHETFSEEVSPHGGLFPEEVILPWLVFERNVERPSFTINVAGSGQANKQGEAALHILNISSYEARLMSTEINLGTHIENINIDQLPAILPKSDNTFKLIIKSWPSVDQTQTGSLKVEILLPNGELIINSISLKDLKSESMYARDNILEDLI